MTFSKLCDECKEEIKGKDGRAGYSEWCIFHFTKRRDFCSRKCFLNFVKENFIETHIIYPRCHVCKKAKLPYMLFMTDSVISMVNYKQAREKGEICERCNEYFALTNEFKEPSDEELQVARDAVHFANNMSVWWQKDKPFDIDNPTDEKENREWDGIYNLAKWYREEHKTKEKTTK